MLDERAQEMRGCCYSTSPGPLAMQKMYFQKMHAHRAHVNATYIHIWLASQMADRHSENSHEHRMNGLIQLHSLTEWDGSPPA